VRAGDDSGPPRSRRKISGEGREELGVEECKGEEEAQKREKTRSKGEGLNCSVLSC